MLLRHGVSYAFARGLPGLVSLAAISVYSRLLGPEDYGRYALVIAGVAFGNKLAFEWLRLALLRFLPGADDREKLLSTLTAAFVGMVAVTAAIALGALVVVDDPMVRRLFGVGAGLLWVQALFDLELERARSQLRPLHYGAMAASRAVLALALGVVLVTSGLGSFGPLLALLAAMLVTLGWAFGREHHSLRRPRFSRERLAAIARYGTPLAATGGLGIVVASSDRFLIGWLLDEAAVGHYAVAYDLASFTVGLLLMIVNLAAYPLVMRVLEDHGPEQARHQLGQSLSALLAIGVPAVIGLAVLARPIAEAFLGARYATEAAALIPLVALAALLCDVKAYFFDLAFQLGRNTVHQIWITAAAALVNLGLNLLWIPALGLAGAAYATILAYLVGLVLSGSVGRRAFVLPGPSADAFKIVLAALVMAGAIWALAAPPGAIGLTLRVSAGVMVYATMLVCLNGLGCRSWLLRRLRPRRTLKC